MQPAGLRDVHRSPDLCVIGGGSAGIAAATAGVALGLDVTLVEQRDAAHDPRHPDFIVAFLGHEVRRMRLGRSSDLDWTDCRKRLARALNSAAIDRRLARLSAMNIRVVQGRAHFVARDLLAVGDAFIGARRFVIATGTRPRKIEGLPENVCLRLESLVGLQSMPDHLLVLGQDADAVTVAQFFRKLGGTVTVLAKGDLLPHTDDEFGAPLRRALMADGVGLQEGEPDARIVANPAGGVTAHLSTGQHIEASHIFLLDDVTPAIAGLGLETAGISCTGAQLALSGALRTRNPRVFAVGSVAGAASGQAIQAQVKTVMTAAFFRLPVRYDPGAVPIATATDPQIATVGLSEADARQKGPVTIWRWPGAETEAARLSGDHAGLVKIVADRNGRVLGAGAVGSGAAEQIAFWSLTIAARLTVRQVAGVPLPGFTVLESSARAILPAVVDRLRGPWVKRIISQLARLG